MTRRALIVFARQPTPGQSKVHLSPPLTDDQAAALYACLLVDTLENVRAACKLIELQPIIAFRPASAEAYFRDLAPDFERLPQGDGNRAERINRITLDCLSGKYDQVVVVDSDSPTLPLESLRRAFSLLDGGADVTLGPSDDGGYYLIGLKRPAPELFLGVAMHTPHVVNDTLARARDRGLRVAMLPEGYDIDTVDDVYRLVAELGSLPPTVALRTRIFMVQNPEILVAGA